MKSGAAGSVTEIRPAISPSPRDAERRLGAEHRVNVRPWRTVAVGFTADAAPARNRRKASNGFGVP